MNNRIAVLEDDVEIRDLIKLHLEKASFKVRTFSRAEDFFNALSSESFALLLLDLMLPDMDGLDVCKAIKRDPSHDMPVIMVTAKTEIADRIVGLELGADDYISKPFSPRELVARVRSVLRRFASGGQGEAKIDIGVLSIDPGRHEVAVEGRKIDSLTQSEFKILCLLASRQGWVFSRDKILEALWEGEKLVIERTVDVHVKNLRDKLGKAKSYIKNVRGVGYKIEV